jgi:23S rRNA G2069 N7-methylase RlmK/C1962 C5-methylase RlmI
MLYTVKQLLQLRRQMLRFARSIAPGPARNERRQIADSLRRLFRNKEWRDAHLVEESTTEYRVMMVEADGNSRKTIEIDRPDDAAAVETAKQFIDGKDIELWQSNRKVAAFEREPE